ncbi:uncharacterized protein JN550_006311 [Neoarthrinium moseri]|uniref:uncharacterized protein n=1 Tax=Neoarthrinium moseri TaxID=1658444 RepID=UPI001FDCD4D4|nr:uncharacterized protein JN550_006311 [Neoarthrinium moseri]KAI1868736.1 hypothetical protein JN550_006311 [Neoarthrinium moseri]
MAAPVDVTIPDWAAAVPEDAEVRPGKRSRVALACQRCKVRKQKCNGAKPCSKCQSLGLPCEYVIPQKPMPFGKNQYIKSLERRVAELETILSKQGISDLSKDHWSSLRAEQTGRPVEDAASSTHTPDTDDFDHELDWQDGFDNVVSVLRSLSMDANGTGYIGGTSHVTMGKLFSFIGSHRGRNGGQSRRRDTDLMQPLDQPSLDDVEPIDFSEVAPEVADRLLVGWLKHIATRFPVVHSVWVRQIHERRHSLAVTHEKIILHLVYASGGRFLETAGEFGLFYPQRHYASALSHMGAILDYDDIRSVTILMLMAVFCLRNSVGPGAWTYSRMAMLVALNLGLHRKTNAMKRPSIENELRKRMFWATYAFDRQISIPLGRPFAISDRDIDVPLPWDIDESTTAEDFSRLSEPKGNDSAPEHSTSLSSFVRMVKLRRIESDIQQTIYRVDLTPEISDTVVDKFLERLAHWKAMIPLDCRQKRDLEGVPFDGYDVYMVFFCKCKRLLLFPEISKTPVNPRYLKECAMACAGACGAYKRLHQVMSVGYSIMSVQTVFMAGLTLVYCIWISPNEVFDITTSSGIHDCSIVLFVIAERIGAAKKYRNAFEVIRQRVIDQVSDGSSRQPRKAMSGLVAELGPSVHSWDVNQPFEVDHDSFEQFSHIISDMSGGFPGLMDPFSDMSGEGAPAYAVDASYMQTTPFAPEAPRSPDMVSPTRTFGANLPEFDDNNPLDIVYNDSISPWFSAATVNTTMADTHKLFTPLQIANGCIALKHRIIMAPMTRNRGVPLSEGTPDAPNRIWLPDDLVALYYGQRASPGGLLITEGIPPSIEASGMPNVPGLFDESQVPGWKKVVKAVHAKGGFIYAQLWHAGRATIPQFSGTGPVSASATPWDTDEKFPFRTPFTKEKIAYRDHPPIAMSHAHLQKTINDFVAAAKMAVDIGFDGIEINGGNGNLLDQFLHSNINTRTDEYGGSAEKRCKFVLELTAALAAAIGASNVAIRMEPTGLYQHTRGGERVETWSYLCQKLADTYQGDKKLSYVHFIEPRFDRIDSEAEKDNFYKSWSLPIVSNEPFRKIISDKGIPTFSCGGWDDKNSADAIEKGWDGVVFAKWFTSNPDLPDRIKNGQALAEYDRSRFYGSWDGIRENGYTNYVVYEEEIKAKAEQEEKPPS